MRKKFLLSIFTLFSLCMTGCSISDILNGLKKQDSTDVIGSRDLYLQDFYSTNEVSTRNRAETRVNSLNLEEDSAFISCEALVVNKIRDSFLDIVVYTSWNDKHVVYNEGNGTYVCSSTTEFDGENWKTKIIFDVYFDAAIEKKDAQNGEVKVEEITFLHSNSERTNAYLNDSKNLTIHYHQHRYTEQVRDEKYLLSEADDYHGNLYYYSCSCGKSEDGYSGTTDGRGTPFERRHFFGDRGNNRRKISDVYVINDSPLTVDINGKNYEFPSTYEIVDYSYKENKSGTYTPTVKPSGLNEIDDYFYNVFYGKILAVSPDGTYLLLGDGDDILLLYSGNNKALNTTNYPDISKQYVKICGGSMGIYNLNLEYNYVQEIIALDEEEKALIQEPTLNYRELTEEKLLSLKPAGYEHEKHAAIIDEVCVGNSLRTVTGTVVQDSLKDTYAQATTFQNERLDYSFSLQVGSTCIEIFYNHHFNSKADLVLYESFKEMYNTIGEVTVKGIMSYHINNKNFITTSGYGYWTLIPFMNNHFTM